MTADGETATQTDMAGAISTKASFPRDELPTVRRAIQQALRDSEKECEALMNPSFVRRLAGAVQGARDEPSCARHFQGL